ncbi:tRNA (adenosine(37)-N6)-threonylcarbamoyltransferase complex dimerization subunit type 1 TsaB [Undibacterium sp.]|jgi:tRNA threonylcarbamoyladenosine biosynthesis protein TsaB|uniref:tRNA (adenosine(37)-N6)-threonylcarbamoyltransferase complex dimerization subunit type 1 TsaB n=1 Tax=Undibacterium sp. TaxID=1914977 RepID=UPI002D156AD6|nr:tRNA (adenosine(37)-N6)-threonylcarbamoyltransferase complex dimerization subunit type 1 TsaB [Undibacterium sp.]HTD03547.1 tRNA (adenosine(37)-N6)-threonylcarbamoyltransferase complex dimerization subunit type 1 TsaB [Undibacterium sp.]
MTIILSIETSTELASAALLMDGGVISRELSGVQTHSQGILPMVQALLKQGGIALNQCDAIGFGCGPGAFTGVRTACGIVQGLAFGADLPVIPVVSLLAMAEGARTPALELGCADLVCVLDARMEEVYWARYRLVGADWQVVSEPALSSFAQLLATVDFSGAALVHGSGLKLDGLPSATVTLPCMPHAEQIARLALTGYRAGRGVPAAQAQPLYLRNKIALTTEERMLARQGANSGKGAA